ncbi:MAG TPA: hypothetical protein DCE55_29400 [Planctomycetaceae bacterium]|nr:hypothetical protein [Planctomycetaceae bacterium]
MHNNALKWSHIKSHIKLEIDFAWMRIQLIRANRPPDEEDDLRKEWRDRIMKKIGPMMVEIEMARAKKKLAG